jgi:hypothetical protein
LFFSLKTYFFLLKGEVWAHKTSLISPLFSLTNLSINFAPFLQFYYWILELFDNISYFCSKVQARSAFAMYLIRVQQRLVTEGNPCSQDDSDALNEQMVTNLFFSLKTYFFLLKGEVWAHKTSLISPLFSLTNLCINFAPFLQFYYWILELLGQRGIFCFSIYYLI